MLSQAKNFRFGCPCAVLLFLLLASTPAFAGESPGTAALDVSSKLVRLTSEGTTLEIPLACPTFKFEGREPVGGAQPVSATGDLSSGDTIAVEFAPLDVGEFVRLRVQLLAQWSPEESVLRKWTRVRYDGEDQRLRLDEIVLDNIDVIGLHAQMGPGEIQSYPVFMDGFFAGIEFPIAATSLKDDVLVLAHRPGRVLQPGVWYESRKAVYGLALRGHERQTFQRYIVAHLPARGRLHVDYNSWWTSPVPYTQDDILKLMEQFEANLYKPYGVSLDSFCIDMGWSNPHSLWQIDPKLFPQGFSPIEAAATRMASHLGLWISPGSFYPPALDNDWAARQGYETILNRRADGSTYRTACLGAPRYGAAFRNRLVEMATRYGIRQFKLDGYGLTCPETDHGHAPGPLSAEAIADGFIEAARAVHAVAPDAWLEPTCFGWNPSPWWLFYCNSVIGSFGDDAPHGRVPCPVYRESYTTARDYFNLQGASWSAVPIAAQEVLGIIHQTPEPFMNDAVTTVMRGNLFLPLYVNPACMDAHRWKALADLLIWARTNVELLSETTPLLPLSWQDGRCPKFVADASMPREPYGYAHWLGKRGLVLLRNPWIEEQTYPLTLDVAPDSGPLSVVSLYPEPRVFGEKLRGGDPLDVPLAPYETLVLSIAEGEPPGGLPGHQHAPNQDIKVKSDRTRLERVNFDGPTDRFGPDFTRLFTDANTGTHLRVASKVTVSAPAAELLVLLEDRQLPESITCTVRLDNHDAKLSSTGSETGWSASGQPRPEHWLFFRAPMLKGTHSVQIDLLAGSETARVSAWLWAMRPAGGKIAGHPNALPQPETISLASVPLARPQSADAAGIGESRRERPVERIQGVFLDTLQPVQSDQGWGTLQHNQSVWEKPLVIAGVHYTRGLGTHAPSRIVYNLDGKYRRFQAWAGADSATTPTVTFEVLVDGRTRWKSPLMQRGDTARRVDVDVTGGRRLELVVTDGGNGVNADHADWADAHLLE